MFVCIHAIHFINSIWAPPTLPIHLLAVVIRVFICNVHVMLLVCFQRVEDYVPNLTGRNPGDLGPSWPDHATLVRVFSDPAAQSGFAKVLFYVF